MTRPSTAPIPFSNLDELSRDRSPQTSELFSPNDFYGHAQALKDYCGLDRKYAIKAVLEHGCAVGGNTWGDLMDFPVPGLICFSPARKEFLRSRTGKRIECIGPYIHYARHALDPEALAREKARLGRSLLLFPLHSSTHITCEYDIPELCRTVERIGRDFDSIRVCMYWRDHQLGRKALYESYGFECVSAGHIFDPLFLPRLKSVLATAALTVSNGVGTVMGYSVLMGVPHYFHDNILRLSAENEEIFQREYTPWHEKTLAPDVVEVQEAFSRLEDRITPQQRAVVERYWGTAHLRTPEELRNLFQEFEEAHARRGNVAS